MNRAWIAASALLTSCCSVLAQSAAEGVECRPPVVNPQMYRDCRVHDAGDVLVCRCQVLPGVGDPPLLRRPQLTRTPGLSPADLTLDIPSTGSLDSQGTK